MLRVLEKARSKCPIEISSTFCGAHSVPKGSTAAEVQLSSESTMSMSLSPGNQRCDRETAAGSFEAQGGRSPLTIFGNLADCPFYHRSNECGEYWRVLWKRRLWNPGFPKDPRGSWYVLISQADGILCVCDKCALCRFFLSHSFPSFPKEVSRVEPPLFQAGKAAGFRVNFHGDELNPLGGAEMGAAIQAEAISHLEEVAILMLSASWKMYQAFTMFYQSLKYVKILDKFSISQISPAGIQAMASSG